jgi:hypothetical protein
MPSGSEMCRKVRRQRMPIVRDEDKRVGFAPGEEFRVRGTDRWRAGFAYSPDSQRGYPAKELRS